ncbi:unnamed protein product [Leuciscus chuanchicus]
MEAGEVIEDFNNVPLIASLECREEDSVSQEAGKEFFDDSLQPEQVMASPSLSEATGGSEFMEEPFLELYRRAAAKLTVEWPAPPPVQKSSRFGGFYLSQVQTVVRTHLPIYPDCIAELTSSWSKPMSTLSPVSGMSKFTDLEGAQEAGLMSAPPMEHSLATYLAPMHNSGIAGIPTLPSGPCRFSYRQLSRIYSDQACTARALSTMSLLQTYQAICLGELSEAMSEGRPCDELMGEVRSTAEIQIPNSKFHGQIPSLQAGEDHRPRGSGILLSVKKRPCKRAGGKGRDIQYPAMLNKRDGGFPGDAGNPCCQPGTVARMRTNSMGSSHDSVRLSAAVPLTPPPFRRGNYDISVGGGFPSIKRRNSGSSQQSCNSGGSTGKNGGRVLQSLLPPPKEKWGLTPDFGFTAVEQTPQTLQIQNAHSTSSTILSASPGMVHIGGFDRCVFPCHNSPRSQTISEVLLRGDGIRISSPAVRVVPGTAHIHEVCRSGTDSAASSRHESIRLFGRSTPGRGYQGTSSIANTDPCLPPARSGIFYKSQEELPSSVSADFISQFRDRFSKEHSYAVTSKSREFSQLPESLPTRTANTFSHSVEAAGVDGLNNNSRLTRSPLYACVPEMGAEHWSKCHTAFKQTSNDNASVRSSSGSLGIPESIDRGNPSRQGYVTCSSDDRCIPTWMGSPMQGEFCERRMVVNTEGAPYK